MLSTDEKLKLGSPDRFGYEWARYCKILSESKTQLERWLGSTGLSSFKDKTVLDVGCGMGRNPYWMIKNGVSQVVCMDIDDASLAAAQKNLADFSQAEIKKCSVYDLDHCKHGRFDRVTCIGVLQFLADPPLALKKMWSCVASGGELILWVYGKKGNRLLLPIIHTLRVAGSRLPLPLAHRLAQAITIFAWPIIRLMPLSCDYYRNLKHLSFTNVESIIFDQILPRLVNFWDRNELKALLEPLNGKLYIEEVQGNSWHVRIEKPLSC